MRENPDTNGSPKEFDPAMMAFRRSHNYIVVPKPILNQLQAVGKPVSALLNIRELTSILSKIDVAFYFYCQSLAGSKFFEPVCKTLSVHPAAEIYDVENDLAMKRIGVDRFAIMKEEQDFYIQNHDGSVRPLYDGFFGNTEGGKSIDDYTFTAEEIDDKTIYFTLEPLSESETADKQRLHSYDQLIGLLRRYSPLEALAETPVFQTFVQLCTP